MIRASIHNPERILLESDLPMRDVERAKLLPGMGVQPRSGLWLAPLTWAACVGLRGIFGDELVVADDLNEWVYSERANRIDGAMSMRMAWDTLGDTDLFPFQRAGVAFLTYVERAMLCDEMGTGKTPQSIRTLMNIARNGGNPFPALVVAPNNMVLTWKKEIEQWWPGVRVGVVKGTAAERRKILMSRDYHIWVINIEGVRSHSRLAGYGSISLNKCVQCDPSVPDDAAHAPMKCEVHDRELNQITWRSLIVDEAHRLKDPRSKQTRAVWALRTASTKYVYCLTGTALADSPIDLWPALHLIDPMEHPGKSRYQDRYCLTTYNLFGGSVIIGLKDDTREEFFKILDPRMRRMPKEAVLPFLPPKIYSRRYIEMHAKQAKAYKQMEKNMIAVIGVDGDEVTTAGNSLTKLTRLTQFSSAYAELEPTGEYDSMSLPLMRTKLIGPSNKIDAMLEILEDTGQEQCVVFAQSRQLVLMASEALTRKKISHTLIVGDQNIYERQAGMDDFQAGRVRVIVCTIQAGGTGITLNAANRAIFLQRSWSMIDNKQAEDRIHRIGSEKFDKVEIIDLVSVETIEEDQQLVLAGKEERLQEIMRDSQVLARLKEETTK